GISIEWVVLRNRLSNLDAINKRNINYVLEQLAKRICFKNVSGFSERVIFKELFLDGLTLLDLTQVKLSRSLNIAHVAARQELRDFLNCINIDKIIDATKNKAAAV
ncbi:ATPase MipZ family protein, partial [Orientia tsutsugamushi str. UT144]